jgi:hypothetical protein
LTPPIGEVFFLFFFVGHFLPFWGGEFQTGLLTYQ